MFYIVNLKCVLHWVSWNDEYVVFDESSGQTHLLDPLRAFVLNFLSAGCYPFEVVLTELTAIPALADSLRLSELLKAILSEFGALGLVEVTAA